MDARLAQGRRRERGSALIELLAVTVLFSVLGMSITLATMAVTAHRSHVLNNSLASQLAIEGLEMLAGIDPATLDDGDDLTEEVDRDGILFTRARDVIAEADGSRTVNVTVTCAACRAGGSAELENNYPRWGSE